MNVWDVLILAVLAVSVLLAVRAIRRGKAGGCHACGGDCTACRQACSNNHGGKKP